MFLISASEEVEEGGGIGFITGGGVGTPTAGKNVRIGSSGVSSLIKLGEVEQEGGAGDGTVATGATMTGGGSSCSGISSFSSQIDSWVGSSSQRGLPMGMSRGSGY